HGTAVVRAAVGMRGTEGGSRIEEDGRGAVDDLRAALRVQDEDPIVDEADHVLELDLLVGDAGPAATAVPGRHGEGRALVEAVDLQSGDDPVRIVHHFISWLQRLAHDRRVRASERGVLQDLAILGSGVTPAPAARPAPTTRRGPGWRASATGGTCAPSRRCPRG